jgi:hypothetical protein
LQLKGIVASLGEKPAFFRQFKAVFALKSVASSLFGLGFKLPPEWAPKLFVLLAAGRLDAVRFLPIQ